MPITIMNNLMKQAELLSRKEQLQFAIRLINKARQPESLPLKWRDLRGSIPYPAFGEDAQSWVSRSRAESDRSREWEK